MEIAPRPRSRSWTRSWTCPEGTRIQILAPLVEPEKRGTGPAPQTTPKGRFHQGQDRRGGQAAGGRHPSGQEQEARHQRDGGPAGGEQGHQAPAHRFHGAHPQSLRRVKPSWRLQARREIFFSQKAACRNCGISMPELTPQMFSFNNPQGACAECGGLGTKRYFDPDLIVPDPALSLRKGPLRPGPTVIPSTSSSCWIPSADHYQVDVYTPFRDLPKQVQEVFLYGSGKEEIKFRFERDKRRHYYKRPFEGRDPQSRTAVPRNRFLHDPGRTREVHGLQALPVLQGRKAEAHEPGRHGPGCPSMRSRPLSVEKAGHFFKTFRSTQGERAIADRILKEIRERLGFLRSVGLDYLSLDRPTVHPVGRGGPADQAGHPDRLRSCRRALCAG